VSDQNKLQGAETTGGEQQKRRYVRLEVFSPVGFSEIVRNGERVYLHPDQKAGVLLNLSGGGALISTTDAVTPDALVLLRFDIKGFDTLENILGRVKRIEQQADGECLVGMEFITVEEIEDPKLVAALEKLAERPRGLEAGVSRMISRYVFQRQIETEPQE
jgi:c-di-GMP-binding flagellar brake protein YcgR